jgi:hypothetical protein
MGNAAWAGCVACRDSGSSLVTSSPIVGASPNRVGPLQYRPQPENVYQDMTRPLACYYVFASSNSFLVNHPTVQGKTGIDTVLHCLALGCRFLEFTLHAGR